MVSELWVGLAGDGKEVGVESGEIIHEQCETLIK